MARNMGSTNLAREVSGVPQPPDQHVGQPALPGYDASMYNAPNHIINVAKEPTDPNCGCTPGNCSCGPSCKCMCCWGNGPGGKTTIKQYNEKGILETGLFHVIGMHQSAGLGSDHDSYSQGIYKEHYEVPGYDD